eukprot:scaffold7855_cov109-Skeletonema_menzelii.AAC.2
MFGRISYCPELLALAPSFSLSNLSSFNAAPDLRKYVTVVFPRNLYGICYLAIHDINQPSTLSTIKVLL